MHHPHLSRATATRQCEDSLANRPDVALVLSQTYLQTHHLEAALDALNEVLEDGEVGKRARMLRLEIQARQGADADVLRLGRALAAEMPESPWPLHRLAQAAFASGDRKEAHEAALRELEYLPSNAEVAARLADLAPGALRPDLRTLARAYATSGVCPYGTPSTKDGMSSPGQSGRVGRLDSIGMLEARTKQVLSLRGFKAKSADRVELVRNT